MGSPLQACRQQQVYQEQPLQPYWRTSHSNTLQQHLLWSPTQHGRAQSGAMSQPIQSCRTVRPVPRSSQVSLHHYEGCPDSEGIC